MTSSLTARAHGAGRPRARGGGRGEAREALLDQPRVQAFLHRQRRVDQHLAAAGRGLGALSQLAGKRQQDQVRRTDAIDRRDERDRDAGTELGRIGQVLHHVDQADHGAEDADGRRIAASRLEHSCRHIVPVGEHLDLDLERMPDLRLAGPVDRHGQRAPQERIRFLVELRLEGEDAGPAGPVGIGQHPRDHGTAPAPAYRQ